jgi:hypothetical protein
LVVAVLTNPGRKVSSPEILPQKLFQPLPIDIAILEDLLNGHSRRNDFKFQGEEIRGSSQFLFVNRDSLEGSTPHAMPRWHFASA